MKKLLSEKQPRQVLVTGSLGKSPIAKVLRQHEATLEVTYLNSASTLATPLSRFTSLSQGDVLVISDMEDVSHASRHGMAVLLEVLCERWYLLYRVLTVVSTVSSKNSSRTHAFTLTHTKYHVLYCHTTA